MVIINEPVSGYIITIEQGRSDKKYHNKYNYKLFDM